MAKFYILHVAPDAPLSTPLGLEARASLDECDRVIRWQARGGFPATEYLICTYERRQNRFRVAAMLMSNGFRPPVPPALAACTWAPDRGPFTESAWAEFCGRLGYDPEGEAREVAQ